MSNWITDRQGSQSPREEARKKSEIDRNKHAARAFFQALSGSDAAAVLDAYAEDGTVQITGNTLISGVLDRAEIMNRTNRVLEAFPGGISFTIKTMTAEGDRVAIEAETSAVHASGKIFDNKYHFLMRLRDGKIVKLTEYMDTELVTEVLCGGQRRT
jgi:ketosteroid isomerase-like protein